MGYLHQIDVRLRLLSDCQRASGRGFLKVCQLGCIGQSRLLAHSEQWLMHLLRPHHRGLQDLLTGAMDVVVLYLSGRLKEAYRWHLLALQAVKLLCVTPG